MIEKKADALTSLGALAKGLAPFVGTAGQVGSAAGSIGGAAKMLGLLSASAVPAALLGGGYVAQKGLREAMDPANMSTKKILSKLTKAKGDSVRHMGALKDRGMSKLPESAWQEYAKSTSKKGGTVYSPRIGKGIKPAMLGGKLRLHKGKIGAALAVLAAAAVAKGQLGKQDQKAIPAAV